MLRYEPKKIAGSGFQRRAALPSTGAQALAKSRSLFRLLPGCCLYSRSFRSTRALLTVDISLRLRRHSKLFPGRIPGSVFLWPAGKLHRPVVLPHPFKKQYTCFHYAVLTKTESAIADGAQTIPGNKMISYCLKQDPLQFIPKEILERVAVYLIKGSRSSPSGTGKYLYLQIVTYFPFSFFPYRSTMPAEAPGWSASQLSA